MQKKPGRSSLRDLIPKTITASYNLKRNSSWGGWHAGSQARRETLESPQSSTMEKNTLNMATLNAFSWISMKQKFKHPPTPHFCKNLSSPLTVLMAHPQHSLILSMANLTDRFLMPTLSYFWNTSACLMAIHISQPFPPGSQPKNTSRLGSGPKKVHQEDPLD
jgi:hypothetical protein